MDRLQLSRSQFDRPDDSRYRERPQSGFSTPQSPESRGSPHQSDKSDSRPSTMVSTLSMTDSRPSDLSRAGFLSSPFPPLRYASQAPAGRSDLTLPPLRSVLRSPPSTPGVSQTSHHTSPRDSNYEQASYKLPEMTSRPYKRNCTDDFWEKRPGQYSPDSAPPASPYSRRDSKAVGGAPSDDRLSWPRSSGLDALNIRDNSSRSYSDPERSAGRASGSENAPPTSNYGHPVAEYVDYRHAEHTTHGSAHAHAHTRPQSSWGRVEASDRAMPDPTQRVASDSSRTNDLPYRSGSSSQSSYQPHAPQFPSPGRSDGYYASSSSQVAPVHARYTNAEYPPQSNHGYMPPPTVYGEYANAKSRKRSNLPKQSTEIMKRWFDEHIDNPYPSEEQKKYFAAKANINLTQVSNWFINHRRRCPELKDKRDKGQAGDKDEYY